MTAIAAAPKPNSHGPLLPIALWQVALFFFVPGVLKYIATYFIVPPVVEAGFPLIWAWTLAVFLPYQPLAIALVIQHFRQPGNNWRTFAKRFRFTAIPRHMWKWIALAFPIIVISNFMLEGTVPILSQIFPPSPAAPELFADPNAAVEAGGAIGTFFGVPMQGNVWLLGFWLMWSIMGVTGEEVIWRGYLLPRMELTQGRWAWLYNGIMWDVLFHLFTLYNMLTDLPFMLIIPFLAQRTKSTWTSIILHIGLQWLAFLILVPGVFSA